MTIDDVVAAVITGEFDGEFDMIHNAIRARERINSLARSAGVRVGDRIRLVDSVSPKYLGGVEGLVTGIERPRGRGKAIYIISVDEQTQRRLKFASPQRNFVTQGSMRVPEGLFEKTGG